MYMTQYDMVLENAVAEITGLLKYNYCLSQRSMAFLLLQEDKEATALVNHQEQTGQKIMEIVVDTKRRFSQPLNYVIMMYRRQAADQILDETISIKPNNGGWPERLSYFTMWPPTGIPILLMVLYLGMYKFVGQFGAGIIVEYLENITFGAYINPLVNRLLENYCDQEALRALIGGEYGIITLGFRYAIAIVLPVVGTFFIAFSLLEDSGYLPRLAMLVDGLFKIIGLNGRAVIPITLGFGCGTMATMVTRTLETWRERLIATFLLALAIPCSAQLGLIMGMLSVTPGVMLAWALIVGGVFWLFGLLANRLIPGQRSVFYMELPPLRIPNLSNVFMKSYTRVKWYFWEILPLFIGASCMIWLGKMTGSFDWLMLALAPLTAALGLPVEVSKIFIFGFFRRDYGAAGLYDLLETGGLTTEQLLVTATVLTLFVPCIAQFTVMIKERGWGIALGIAGLVFPLAFLVGYLLHCFITVLYGLL